MFEPELGQMMYGHCCQQYECPEYFIALLQNISYEISRVTGNQGESVDPATNEGSTYKNSTFEIRSYSWVDCVCNEDKCSSCCEACLPNFQYKDILVSWYKYLGRGTSINKEITPNEAINIFNECIASISNEQDMLERSNEQDILERIGRDEQDMLERSAEEVDEEEKNIC